MRIGQSVLHQSNQVELCLANNLQDVPAKIHYDVFCLMFHLQGFIYKV